MHSSIFLNIYPVKGCGDSGAYLSTNCEFGEFTITTLVLCVTDEKWTHHFLFLVIVKQPADTATGTTSQLFF